MTVRRRISCDTLVNVEGQVPCRLLAVTLAKVESVTRRVKALVKVLAEVQAAAEAEKHGVILNDVETRVYFDTFVSRG